MTNRVRTGDIQNHNLAEQSSNRIRVNHLENSLNLVAPTVAPANRKIVENEGLIPVSLIGGNPSEVKPVETDFAGALIMIAALPLTDFEKAKAVRRLLGSD